MDKSLTLGVIKDTISIVQLVVTELVINVCCYVEEVDTIFTNGNPLTCLSHGQFAECTTKNR